MIYFVAKCTEMKDAVCLLEAAKGCTMLLHYPEGASQMSRMDSRDDGSDLDSGIRSVNMFSVYYSK